MRVRNIPGSPFSRTEVRIRNQLRTSQCDDLDKQ